MMPIVPTPSSKPFFDAAEVLIVEDISSLQLVYASHVQKMGLTAHIVDTAKQALSLFTQKPFSIVLLDLMLPDGDGMELIDRLLRLAPNTQIIVITAERSPERAVTAMRAGAFDYLTKPVSEARLQSVVSRALSHAREIRPLTRDAAHSGAVGAFIGHAPEMLKLYDRIRQTAASDASVFIVGESGTGKEICAEAIHLLSPRASNPFVVFDCSAIRQDRFDSELFGHMRGALPGAITDHAGAAMRADGGTLFLDKLTELDPALQGKLLRFLQTQRVRPVGAAEERKVDLRIISASDIPPQEAVEQGKLRSDLFYRLCVVAIHIPPLRNRSEDIPALAEHFLTEFSAQEQRNFTRITPQALQRLKSAYWSGNVRELMNMIRSAVILNCGPDLTADMLSTSDGTHMGDMSGGNELSMFDGQSLAEIERRIIEYRLSQNDHSVPQVARGLHIAPSTLYRKLEAWKTTGEEPT
ncbi:sigma-54-dependent transcriptional regulator [Thioclava sp. GXIMD4215]|uniref:sigma-54-dependent transcriptional regulator n=1 Tax=Thioclava sp. GXIMD4215 TaxID=3131928 RepID=UPI003245701F